MRSLKRFPPLMENLLRDIQRFPQSGENDASNPAVLSLVMLA